MLASHPKIFLSNLFWHHHLHLHNLIFCFLVSIFSVTAQTIHPSEDSENALRTMTLAPGIEAKVYASEPFFVNPVAFDFDDQGRCYVVETHRRRSSVFDIRSFRDWLEDDFSFRRIEDRNRFLQASVFQDNPSIDARFQVDRNGDGIFDVGDLEVESEKIQLLEDTDNDGIADRVSTFAEGFDTAISGVAAGVLAFGDSIWFACVPDLWRLKDLDQNGQADHQELLHTGFGVHIAFGGHDFHGLIMGPDGRLYFSIADRGAHIEKDGKVLASFPDEGAVFRCLPDGSEFEVVARGFRNPQELVFDDFGNLWTVDNNGDGGDQARLIQIVEGGNSGWHIGWQWQPDMGAWKSERLWCVASENTAAYLLPPLAYVGHGPAGLAFYPGTGLSDRFKDHFFLADFPGGIRTFTVKPDGASFRISHSREYLQDNSPENMEGKIIWGCSPVDVGFSPNGGIYVADWTTGWAKTGKGRLFHLIDPASDPDEIAEVKRLLAKGFDDFSIKDLTKQLEHDDRRIRLRAQFELVNRHQPSRGALIEAISGALGLSPLMALKRVIEESKNPLTRTHAIWAVGQLISKQPNLGSILLPFLNDADPEIRAQIAKTLGDRGGVGFYLDYLRILDDPNLRVQFYGALWLGKTVLRGHDHVHISDESDQMMSLKESRLIFNLLRKNADSDLYLRHAAVMSLTYMNDLAGLIEAANDVSRSVRLAAVLALRRLKRQEISVFLDDEDPQIVLETARAIYDENIEDALPQLADLIHRSDLQIPILRRSINALLRLGKTENAAFLVAFAEKKSAPQNLREEALDALSVWGNPPKRDRLLGIWRPMKKRDIRSAVVPFRLRLSRLLNDHTDGIRVATIKAMQGLGLKVEIEDLQSWIANPLISEKVQKAAFDALVELGGRQFVETLKRAKSSEILRDRASEFQAKLPVKEALKWYRQDLEEGSIVLKQAALKGLGSIDDREAEGILSDWMDRLLKGDLDRRLILDVLDASSKKETLSDKVKLFEDRQIRNFENDSSKGSSDNSSNNSSDNSEDDSENNFMKVPFMKNQEMLYGGDADRGRQLFERQDLGCVRCHKLGEIGGNVGPILAGIGSRLSRENMLQSILDPNSEITPGYQSVSVELKNGGYFSGIVKEENETELLINSFEDGLIRLEKAEIASRIPARSAMPEGMSELLSKRELRDLIEFLASLK